MKAASLEDTVHESEKGDKRNSVEPEGVAHYLRVLEFLIAWTSNQRNQEIKHFKGLSLDSELWSQHIRSSS